MSESDKAGGRRVAPRNVRRAPKSIGGVQRSSLRVHLTSSERALLEAKANNQGWSLSRTLVHAALHPASAQEIDTDNLAEVITDASSPAWRTTSTSSLATLTSNRSCLNILITCSAKLSVALMRSTICLRVCADDAQHC